MFLIYQAELAGGLALDRLIEDATEALEYDDGLRELTGLLPSTMTGLLPPICGGGAGDLSPTKTQNHRKTAANRSVSLRKPNSSNLLILP